MSCVEISLFDNAFESDAEFLKAMEQVKEIIMEHKALKVLILLGGRRTPRYSTEQMMEKLNSLLYLKKILKDKDFKRVYISVYKRRAFNIEELKELLVFTQKKKAYIRNLDHMTYHGYIKHIKDVYKNA